jgi:hypothetical protein
MKHYQAYISMMRVPGGKERVTTGNYVKRYDKIIPKANESQ